MANKNKGGDYNFLQKFSLFFFKRPSTTAIIWLVIAVFGIASYTTFLKREGFPSANTPFALGNGTYLVNNPAEVDQQIGKPVSSYLMKQDGVKSVQSQSFPNFYTIIVNYKEGIDSVTKSEKLNNEIKNAGIIPAQATFKLSPYQFGFTQRGDDLVIALYKTNDSTDTQDLVNKAKQVATYINSKSLSQVDNASIIDPFENAFNPSTGQIEASQRAFDRYGIRQNNQTNFYNSVVIGVKAKDNADFLKLDDEINKTLVAVNSDGQFKGYKASISGSFAPGINEQIDTLQKSLLEGLIAVLIIGSIVIAVRASIITVLSMITVITATLGLLFLIGYTLNTITLFALILGLSLIVDDTIIMVEALDKQRQRQKTAEKAVSEATRKVSRAMVAATSTAVLSFVPLLFVGGILGSFIRAIPVTIISALILSLIVALMFIPLFARYLLLGKKQMGNENVKEVAAGIEAGIARFISAPMLWAKGSTKKLLLVGISAIIIGFGFIGTGGYLFKKVTFNIFPEAKDSNEVSLTITMPPKTDINSAQSIADQVDSIVVKSLGDNFVKASYYGQGTLDTAQVVVQLTPYQKREATAPQIVKELKNELKNYQGAQVEVAGLSAGPPAAPFTVLVKSDTDREAALKLSNDIASFVENEAVLKRPDGSIAKVDKVSTGNSTIYYRKDAEAFVSVSVKYVDTDTTTLFTLTEDVIKKEFTPEKVESYGLPRDALQFDTGSEQENQDSFKTLAIAFPFLLLAIYVLLGLQFRSLLQPLLIFMALPFSLFGITLGLWLTDNPFSFFAMLGFFALIGLSIKNTILLTDYANQAKRAGMGTVDAAHEALAERFRPLIATSFTAVVSLIPLTLSSPFWEGLGVVLIFGLLSSTFLVVTVFPYYYLGAEFLRMHINRTTGIGWLLLSAILIGFFVKINASLVLLGPILAAILIWAVKKAFMRRANA